MQNGWLHRITLIIAFPILISIGPRFIKQIWSRLDFRKISILQFLLSEHDVCRCAQSWPASTHRSSPVHKVQQLEYGTGTTVTMSIGFETCLGSCCCKCCARHSCLVAIVVVDNRSIFICVRLVAAGRVHLAVSPPSVASRGPAGLQCLQYRLLPPNLLVDNFCR